MRKKEIIKRKKYEGLKAIPIRGIGIRNNTKTHISGSDLRREERKTFI